MKNIALNEKKYYNKYFWFLARKKLLHSFIKSLNLTSNAKIIDIGAGTGENSDLFSSDFKKLIVTDISFESIKISKNSPVVSDAQELPFKSSCFDLIMMNDILEHLKSDTKALSEAWRCLKSNGYLIISVPAFQFLFSSHDINLCHFRRYDKQQIIKLIDKKFNIIKITYWNFMLFFPYVLIRLILKFAKNSKRQNRIFFSINKYINNILLFILKFENYLILKGVSLPVGTSLQAILKKI